jgi:hypothetical protein
VQTIAQSRILKHRGTEGTEKLMAIGEKFQNRSFKSVVQLLDEESWNATNLVSL